MKVNRKTGMSIAIALACVVAAGLYMQRAMTRTATTQSGSAPAADDAAGARSRASDGSGTSAGNVDGSPPGAAGPGADSDHLPPPGDAVAAPHGPVPMSAENAERVANFAKGLAAGNERQGEFLHLATHEQADPGWSPQMQDALARSLRERYGRRTGLEVGEPRCTRSICTLSSVSTAISGANDWQSLMVEVMNEPWFEQEFFDASTTVGTDERGPVHVTYFVRRDED